MGISKRFASILFAVLVLFAAAGCTKQEQTGSIVHFKEIDPQSGMEMTRMIVTPGYLRIDNGLDDENFLLFDRAKRIIYSTNSIDKRVLVVHPLKVTVEPPVSLNNKLVEEKEKVPDIADKKIQRYRVITNDQVCYDLYAARGFLPDVVAALREYRLALAGEQATTLSEMPVEMLSACDLANNIFYVTRHLDQGFPVRQQDMRGRVRELDKFELKVAIKPGLFEMPEGYSQFSPGDMRDGGTPDSQAIQ